MMTANLAMLLTIITISLGIGFALFIWSTDFYYILTLKVITTLLLLFAAFNLIRAYPATINKETDKANE